MRAALTTAWRGMWEALPDGASTFLKRALLLLLIWKSLYGLVLNPVGEPDRWLVRTLGESTSAVLNLAFGEQRYRVRHFMAPRPGVPQGMEFCAQVYRPGKRSDIGIYPGCNGLELMVLSAGFILCFEGGAKRKSAYILSSILCIMLVNIVRCCLLTVIKTDHPVYFVFAHKYLFNLSGYAVVFLFWMGYVKGSIEPADAGEA